MATIRLKKTLKHNGSITYFLLVSRLFLFIFFQALIAIIVHSWEASEKYWLLFSIALCHLSLIYILFCIVHWYFYLFQFYSEFQFIIDLRFSITSQFYMALWILELFICYYWKYSNIKPPSYK